MARVVPSQVVGFITASFEWSSDRGGKREFYRHSTSAGGLSATIAAIASAWS